MKTRRIKKKKKTGRRTYASAPLERFRGRDRILTRASVLWRRRKQMFYLIKVSVELRAPCALRARAPNLRDVTRRVFYELVPVPRRKRRTEHLQPGVLIFLRVVQRTRVRRTGLRRTAASGGEGGGITRNKILALKALCKRVINRQSSFGSRTVFYIFFYDSRIRVRCTALRRRWTRCRYTGAARARRRRARKAREKYAARVQGRRHSYDLPSA